ncbi:hypothetical protein FRC03_007266, partial [Tulasnella sp. 419]
MGALVFSHHLAPISNSIPAQNRPIRREIRMKQVMLLRPWKLRFCPARTYKRRQAGVSGFVRSEGGDFKVDGKPFYFVGTAAYWLTQ